MPAFPATPRAPPDGLWRSTSSPPTSKSSATDRSSIRTRSEGPGLAVVLLASSRNGPSLSLVAVGIWRGWADDGHPAALDGPPPTRKEAAEKSAVPDRLLRPVSTASDDSAWRPASNRRAERKEAT